MIARVCLALFLFCAASGGAAAQSCNFTIQDVVFAGVDVTSSSNVDTQASVGITCTGITIPTTRVCPNIGAGSGGATSTVRKMIGPGGAVLNYQLYSDANRSVTWGSSSWGFPGLPPTWDLGLSLGGISTSATIYARVFGGQNTLSAGTYTSSFTTADTDFVYQILGSLTGCPLILPQHRFPTFTVKATVNNNCAVTASNVDFGTRGVLRTNIDAAGEVQVTCTKDAPYSLGLDNGLTGTAPLARKMKKGTSAVTYALYKDAARSIAWGSTVGVDVLGGTGNGSLVRVPIYGRVPPQTTPSAGDYSDSVVVTVNY